MKSFVIVAGVMLGLSGAIAQAPKVHRLEATPDTVAYGFYWSQAKPVLRIASGDIIDVDTLLTNSPNGLTRAGVPPEKIQASLRAIVEGVTGERRGPGGHILSGPVYVEGAEPGDVLEVKVLSIDLPIDYGYNGCSGFVPENCDRTQTSKIIQLDRKTMTAEFMPGIVIPLKPFFGSMGVAPASDLGRVSSNPPSRHAGNLDNRELVAGSTLYIPVFVPGALFEVGDGHAAQGDGEVCSAIEAGLTGTFELYLRDDMQLDWPLAETPTHVITMAFHPDLDDCVVMALRDMVKLICHRTGLSREDAFSLCSIAADIRVTQVVNGNKGIHIMIERKYLSPSKS